MNTKTITLTPYQAEFLDDRPDDCIHEGIFEDRELYKIIHQVKVCIRSRKINLAEFTPVMEEILVDCLAGSTVCGQLVPFMGRFDSPKDQLAYATAVRTSRLLADKFRAAGLSVGFVPDA
jgi:hypothetical protein